MAEDEDRIAFPLSIVEYCLAIFVGVRGMEGLVKSTTGSRKVAYGAASDLVQVLGGLSVAVSLCNMQGVEGCLVTATAPLSPLALVLGNAVATLDIGVH